GEVEEGELMRGGRKIVGVAMATGLACQPRAPVGPPAAATPPVPGQGGPAWRELTTPHFTIWTDADAARARTMALRMEQLRQIVVRGVFPGAPASARDLAIIVRDDAELRTFS